MRYRAKLRVDRLFFDFFFLNGSLKSFGPNDLLLLGRIAALASDSCLLLLLWSVYRPVCVWGGVCWSCS